ncbi:hypothetical protein ABEV00_28425 [Paenibacillus thiaminolyticus]|uniref:hypothetical protein n=1 Tax=Paenibacillus thiaminolyticus TaxID=49283 RepID=UPI003D2CD464
MQDDIQVPSDMEADVTPMAEYPTVWDSSDLLELREMVGDIRDNLDLMAREQQTYHLWSLGLLGLLVGIACVALFWKGWKC